LQQIPLTVSPFVQLPTAVTLPYSYQSLPLAFPHSSTAPVPSADGSSGDGYITSPSGNVSKSPEDIIHSCHTLIQHLQNQKPTGEQTLQKWEQSIEERELMEKRRVAPGYLDTGLRILEPTRNSPNIESSPSPTVSQGARPQDQGLSDAGDHLDRVFGKLAV